jgi:hypothetical protein
LIYKHYNFALTISEAVSWYLLIVIKASQGFANDADCLLVGVRVCTKVVQAAAVKGLLARPFIALHRDINDINGIVVNNMLRMPVNFLAAAQQSELLSSPAVQLLSQI